MDKAHLDDPFPYAYLTTGFLSGLGHQPSNIKALHSLTTEANLVTVVAFHPGQQFCIKLKANAPAEPDLSERDVFVNGHTRFTSGGISP